MAKHCPYCGSSEPEAGANPDVCRDCGRIWREQGKHVPPKLGLEHHSDPCPRCKQPFNGIRCGSCGYIGGPE